MDIGQFTIVRRLAVGGMAEIFLARQKSVAGFQRNVVIKRILPEYSQNQEFVESFLNEAKLAAQLQHPNIVQIYDLGLFAKSYFIAMEYIKGFDLSAILRHTRNTSTLLPVEVALTVVRDLLAALDYAHHATDVDGQALGIVHRDVTPSNVIVTHEGDAKVVDFGIAKATAKSEGRTRTGTVKGKMSYLAPEQALAEDLDRRADVFTASIVLYELLTNENPFRADTDWESIRNIVEEDPKPIHSVRTELPPVLSEILAKGLAKARDDRYATCGEMLSAIEEAARAHGFLLSHARNRAYLQEHHASLEEAAKAIDDEWQNDSSATSDARELSDVSAVMTVAKRPAWRWPAIGAGVVVLAIAGAVYSLDLLSPPPEPPPPAALTAVEVAPPPASAPVAAEPPPPIPAAKKPKKDPPPKKEPSHPAAVSGPPGKIKFIVQPWAVVTIDGVEVGTTPMLAREIPAGTHANVLSNPELGRTTQRMVSVPPGQEITLRVNLGD